MVHASRLAEDVALWTGRGWVRLPDAWATGSSMLPQKRNPDVAELVRGRAGTVLGRLAGFLATLKGLPLAYARDLQEDKAAAFEAADLLVASMGALAGLVAGLEPDKDAMRRDAEATETTAVDLAEALVRAGVPFREAHAAVGAAVRLAATRSTRLADLPPEDLAGRHPPPAPGRDPPPPCRPRPLGPGRRRQPRRQGHPRLHQPLPGRRPAHRPRGRRLSRQIVVGRIPPGPGPGPGLSAGTGRGDSELGQAAAAHELLDELLGVDAELLEEAGVPVRVDLVGELLGGLVGLVLLAAVAEQVEDHVLVELHERLLPAVNATAGFCPAMPGWKPVSASTRRCAGAPRGTAGPPGAGSGRPAAR